MCMENVRFIVFFYLKWTLIYLKCIYIYQKTGEKVSNLGFYALKYKLVLGSFLKLLKLGSARHAGQKAQLGSARQKAGSGVSLKVVYLKRKL